ncbi:MAG: hypothetical protein WAN54_21010 [Syntrophobacteraceae bacterium]
MNLVQKAYYNHIPISQGIFGWWTKVHGGHCRALTGRSATLRGL